MAADTALSFESSPISVSVPAQIIIYCGKTMRPNFEIMESDIHHGIYHCSEDREGDWSPARYSRYDHRGFLMF